MSAWDFNHNGSLDPEERVFRDSYLSGNHDGDDSACGCFGNCYVFSGSRDSDFGYPGCAIHYLTQFLLT